MPQPQQLALDFGTAFSPSWDNFVGNEEVVDALKSILDINTITNSAINTLNKRIYLFGPLSSGRSHLLVACCASIQMAAGKSYSLDANSVAADFIYSEKINLYTVDDVDQFNTNCQFALFNLFNQMQDYQILICTGIKAPLGLNLREDLRTRLAWGLVLRLIELNDEQKITALTIAAKERGLQLPSEVLSWLIKHYPRDLISLLGLLDALDQFSLEKKRPLTLPLIRELIFSIN